MPAGNRVGSIVELSKITSSPSNGDLQLTRHADEIRDRLNAMVRIVDQMFSVPAARPSNQPVTERDIRLLLKLRRSRDRFFDGELFADPAWDILLELYAADLGQQRISVSSLCVGAAVPPTTALRWINTLESAGWIERRPDPMDGRRYFLSLSCRGLESMSAYFRTAPTGTPLI